MTDVRATPRRRTERAMSVGGGTPLDQYQAERCCSFPSCESRLSRYNPNPTCAAHGGWQEEKPARRRRRRD